MICVHSTHLKLNSQSPAHALLRVVSNRARNIGIVWCISNIGRGRVAKEKKSSAGLSIKVSTGSH